MKDFFKLYRIFLSYIKEYRFLRIFSIVASLLLIFTNSYVFFLLKDLVDSIDDSPEKLLKILLEIGFFIFLPGVFEMLTFIPKGIILSAGRAKLSADLYEKTIKQDYSYHLNKQSGKLISQIIQDRTFIDSFSWGVEWWSLEALGSLIVPIGLLFALHPYIAFATIIGIIISIPILYFVTRHNYFTRKDVKETEYRRNTIIVDGISNFETVRSFGNEDHEVHMLQTQIKEHVKAMNKYQMAYRYVDLATRASSLIIFLLATMTSFYLFKDGIITLGAVVVVVTFQFQLISKLFGFFYTIRNFLNEKPVMDDIVEILETKTSVNTSPNPQSIVNPKGKIEFKNVSFGYKDGNQVLGNLNLKIAPKQTVAFVGPSGGGKTTAVRLLMRYYDTTEGEILIDGVNVKNLPYEQLRELFGLVPQEPVLFNRSIFYNVAYALQLSSKDDEESHREIVEEACKKAQIHDFIMTLPNKYDTIVGERGLKLSGGQKQRIAIARVIIKDPQIVIFDEATSMLDSESEMAIQKAFKILSKDKTTIIIAHRLSTIRNADKIFVLGDSHILEQGTHESLLTNKGVYNNLWKIQSGGFIKG